MVMLHLNGGRMVMLRSDQFKEGRMVVIEVACNGGGMVMLREVACLMEKEWSCYRGVQFNGVRMVVTKETCLIEGE